MDPVVETHGGFTVMGVIDRVPPGDPYFYRTMWMKRYMPHDNAVKPLSTDQAYYGVCFRRGPGEQEYLAGMAVPPGTQPAEGLVIRLVPAARYAALDCTVATLAAASDRIYGEWLPASAFELDTDSCEVEFYPPQTQCGESPVRLMVPIREQAGAA